MRSTLGFVFLGAAVLLACACGADQSPPIKPPPPPTLAPVATASAPPTASSEQPMASTPPQKSKLEKMIDAVKALADATNAHDAKKLASVYAETATVSVYGSADLNGRAAIEADEQKYFAAFSDLKLGVGRVFANEKESMAAAEWGSVATNSGEWSGIKPQSKKVGVRGISFLWFDDSGLVIREHRYSDTMTIIGQATGQRDARALAELPGAMEVYASKGTPDEMKAVDATKGIYAAESARKTDYVVALATDDSTLDDYSMATAFNGKRGIATYLGMLETAFPDLQQTAQVVFAADDFVVAERALKGTQKGRLGSIAPTRKAVDLHEADVFHWKDGKLLHVYTYSNGAELLAQLGKPVVSPPPPSR